MTKEQIDEILDRVRTWPAEEQEKAADVLLAMEGSNRVYQLSDEDRASIRRGLEQARRGEFASDEDVKALFNRYR
jgi:predicted transcriptional regulator